MLNLSELLARTAAGAPGIRAVSLLGLDGIAVETVLTGAEDAGADSAGLEVELAELLRSTRRSLAGLGWAASNSMVLEAGDMTLLARAVGADYYLLMIVDSSANVDRAGLELFRTAATILEAA